MWLSPRHCQTRISDDGFLGLSLGVNLAAQSVHAVFPHCDAALGFPQPVCGGGIDLLEDLLSMFLDFCL